MPIKPKKFGAFAGVFTPSILTILGVIMYMRLGWVVGQAGLINALIIILIAHVISISTGLSISSIATDKKIRAGGIYYILSRSLGLPMGGAIGIALFVGTALSIALYLVGFAENFLGIEAIQEFFGLEQNKDGYRIIGTAAIIILVIIAFISTSLAIKTQFYILGAIALSIVSIFVGFYLNTDLAPETTLIKGAEEEIPLELIFAIFFPAVTGFTAGVAMSGDLKNPKTSIPGGTMASITVGLVIYIVLAIALAFFVNRELLLTDKNFLMRIAWFSPLVIAGIWGATLSSALGGILGGPRILQAISADRIGPKFFAKTFGKNNEPRVALIVIFIIAEIGILIGELNVIAGIVSMFYLASYGFINLAFFLESWASTDFRPSFKVNRFIGLIGFIAAFGVMFQLDMVSMFAALIIMWGLYFYLTRKKFKTNYGDVWQSVYSSIIRTALHRMDKKETEERNWQPNIILFSGGTKKRPHLIEFGKSIVGKHGVLSNFDLVENKNSQVLFPKHKQSIPVKETDYGIFTRRQTVSDVYEGIETISRVYGFSGFEPNTVLAGWARQTQNPKRFTETLNTLYNLDLNVLLMDYDKEAGFGEYKQIDIWWKDISNQGNLALSLTKLLVLSGDWQNANIRLMIVNSKNELSEKIITRAEHLLDSMRINAQVKVINNEIEQRSLYDIMLIESRNTDLVIFGVPEIIKGKESEFVELTNNLLHKIGTVILIKASSTFKKLSLGLEQIKPKIIKQKQEKVKEKETLIEPIKYPNKIEIKEEFEKLNQSLMNLIDHFKNNYILTAFQFNFDKSYTIEKNVLDAFKSISSKHFLEEQINKQKSHISSLKTNLLIRSIKVLETHQKSLLEEQKTFLSNGINYFIEEIEKIATKQPFTKTILLTKDDLITRESDLSSTRFFKRAKRTFNSKKSIENGIKYELKLNQLVRSKLQENLFQNFEDSLEKMGKLNIEFVLEFQNLINSINKSFTTLEQNAISRKSISTEKKKITSIFENLDAITNSSKEVIPVSLKNETSRTLTELGKVAEKVPANNFITRYCKTKIKQSKIKMLSVPEINNTNLRLLYNGIITDLRLLLIKYRIQKTTYNTLTDFKELVNKEVIEKAQSIKDLIKEFHNKLDNKHEIEFSIPEESFQMYDKNDFKLYFDKITDKIYRNIKAIVNKLPENTEFITSESLNELTNTFYQEVETITLSTYQLVDFYIQSNLIEPLLEINLELPDKLNNSIIKIKDSARRVSFGSSKEDVFFEDLSYEYSQQNLNSFVNEQLDLIINEIKTIEEIVEQSSLQLFDQVNLTTDDLAMYRLLRTPDKYKQWEVGRDVGKRMSILRNWINDAKKFSHDQKANLWYKQSEAFLFAKKITGKQSDQPSTVNSLLNIKEAISPTEDVLSTLPFYYQQLFLRKYNYQSEFWFNRNKELDRTEKAIQRFYSGRNGGVLIKGERNSGKTFFANYIGSKFHQNSNSYYVHFTPSGSVNPEDFTSALQDVTGINDTAVNILLKLPQNSLIIIDNLELWWEKTTSGLKVIEMISQLIQRFGSKHFFLVTVNDESYPVINSMVKIDTFFLDIIDLLPFTSQELQKAIMFRHDSSGFDVRITGKKNTTLSKTDLAKHFSKYFNFSKGNIGVSLLAWVANIAKVENKTIYIRNPQTVDHSIINSLSPELKIYLIQFLIHKRLDKQKIQRITNDSQEVILEKLRFLKRCGLITETADSVFELDKYFHIHIKNELFKKEK